jgi:hypothetical protein
VHRCHRRGGWPVTRDELRISGKLPFDAVTTVTLGHEGVPLRIGGETIGRIVSITREDDGVRFEAVIDEDKEDAVKDWVSWPAR